MQKQPDSSRLQELKNQLAAVTAERDATPGIPPACYADTDLLKQEQLAIFQQGWVCVGRADRWPAAGDFSTMDIAGVPLIVLRNKAGELKSFANSCRHRGSKLLNGEGNCKKIKCPFHWWTYDLDGRLKVYARMENAQNFDPDDFGLVEFPLHCEDGFAFTSFDSNAVAFEEWMETSQHCTRPGHYRGGKPHACANSKLTVTGNPSSKYSTSTTTCRWCTRIRSTGFIRSLTRWIQLAASTRPSLAPPRATRHCLPTASSRRCLTLPA